VHYMRYLGFTVGTLEMELPRNCCNDQYEIENGLSTLYSIPVSNSSARCSAGAWNNWR